MKQLKFLISLVIMITLLFNFSNCFSKRQLLVAKEEAKNYIQFARLPYCLAQSLADKSCPVCKLVGQTGYQVAHVESQVKDNINFNMVVSANSQGEIVISFGGPKSENVSYLQQIYANGMTRVGLLNNANVETEFWSIYSTFFRQSLISTISKLSDKASRVVIVGHSFGGSLAQLASYDLVLQKVLPKKAVRVFTFGSLKVGSHRFVHRVQSLIESPIVRIRRGIDFFALLPRCVFIPHLGMWHCYRSYPYLVRAFPMFAWYYMGYSPFIRRQLVHSVPSIVRHAQSYVSRPVSLAAAQHASNLQNKALGQQHTTAQTPQRHQYNEKIQNKQQEHNTSQRNSQLGSLFDNHQNNKHTGNFINDVSKVFNNHQNTVSKSSLADSNPMKYSGLGNKDNRQANTDFTNTHSHSSALGANSGALGANSGSLGTNAGTLGKNSGTLGTNSGALGTNSGALGANSGALGANSGALGANSGALGANSFTSGANAFASQSPHSYSGLHSQSIHNSNKFGANRSHRQARPRRIMPSRRRSFLETSVQSHSKRNSVIYKSCTTFGHYVSCKFAPETHQVFFGINLETCD